MGYDDSYGGRRQGTSRGDGAAAPSLLGWDSDITDIAELLALLEWDSVFASGTTQAQAEAGLSVNAGDLEFASADAVTAGADADFSARWWVTSLLLPGSQADARVERLVIPAADTAPLSNWRWGFHHFANSAAASPSTPSDFGTYTTSFLGHELTNKSTTNRIGASLWGVGGLNFFAEFARTHIYVPRRAETGGSNQYATVVRAGTSYASSTGVFTQLDTTRGVGFSEFDPARRFRFALEVVAAAGANMASGGNQEIGIRMPRLTLDVLNP